VTNSKPIIQITENAKKEILSLLEKERLEKGENENSPLGLRLGIKGGGCSGLSYLVEFDSTHEGDTVIPYEGFSVYLDRKSTIYLRGILLDHEQGLKGKGFIFRNPNATNTCGCGESFSL